MSHALKLEVFDTGPGPDTQTVLAPEELDALRKASYEEGYSAGWDDAVADTQDATALRQTAAEEALQALSFTQNEARDHVLTALAPLLQAMVDTILPELSRATLGTLVAEQVQALTRDSLGAPVVVRGNATLGEVVARLSESHPGLELVFREEPSLADGQARIQLDAAECRIDTDAAIAAVRAALETFHSTVTERKAHG